MPRLDGRKVVMLVAARNFRDEELGQPKAHLAGLGVKVTVASSTLAPATGMLGARAKPELLLENVSAADFDAVVFVGGSGASEYFQNPTAHALAQEAVRLGKVLGAICIAPATLAHAGVLKGKKATCFPSEEKTLRANGAVFTGAAVETDGKLVTASGPEAAKAFGQALARALA